MEGVTQPANRSTDKVKRSLMSHFKPVQFGKYLLLDKIAVGGMAELYRAKITGVQGFEKLIAIKMILPHLSREEVLVKSFIDEAKLAAFLQHQNIIQIYDFGSMEGRYFIAMEYLFGKDLKETAGKSKKSGMPISLENSLYITTRICTGIDYAHHLKDFYGTPLNIIHRDIGPHNIFITYDGEVKIIDFGIAKAAIQDSTTQAGSIKGKVAYMSPEQAEGKVIDHRSDIFPIGILLYEMVTRQRMFQGNTFEVFSKVRKADFVPAEKINPDLPPKIYEILKKALEKDPDKRYQSATDMLLDLDECIYASEFRPSMRGLSQYMKEMFKKEAGMEKIAIGEAAMAAAEEESGLHDKEQNTTLTTTTDKLNHRDNRPRVGAVAASGLILVAAIVLGYLYVTFFDSSAAGKIGIIYDRYFLRNRPELVEIRARDLKPPNNNEPPKTAIAIQAKKDLMEGVALLEKGQFEAAASVFDTLYQAQKLPMNQLSGPYTKALVGWSIEVTQADPVKAQSLIVKALAMDPNNVQGLMQLGFIHTIGKKYENAIESYQKAAQLEPQNPKIYFNLGYIYAEMKDYDKAEKTYQHTVGLSPPFLDEALFNLAMIQKKLGKKETSLLNVERALEVNPNNTIAKRYLDRIKQMSRKTN